MLQRIYPKRGRASLIAVNDCEFTNKSHTTFLPATYLLFFFSFAVLLNITTLADDISSCLPNS